MRRDVQAVLLVLVGGAVLRISVGDVYLRYVKEGMRPWLLLSGGILVLLGVLMLLDVLRAGRHPHEHDAEHEAAEVGAAVSSVAGPESDPAHVMAPDLSDVDAFDDGHGHAHGGPRSAWMLLLPVLAIFLIAPPALGAYTAERLDTSVIAPADSDVPPLPPGDPVTVALSDYAARAVWDAGRSLAGRNVRMTGFVTPSKQGGWYLTRLQLTCCAADAIATKISPQELPKDAVGLPANTWVTVVGTWVPGGGTQSESAIPWVKVATLVQVPTPRNPYE